MNSTPSPRDIAAALPELCAALQTAYRRHAERGEFGEAQAGRIEELHDRLVSHCEAVVGAELQQASHGVRIERHGESLAGLGCLHVRGRIALQLALPDQVALARGRALVVDAVAAAGGFAPHRLKS